SDQSQGCKVTRPHHTGETAVHRRRSDRVSASLAAIAHTRLCAGLCAGFRTPASTISPRAAAAGVRKAPRHEIASGGSAAAVAQARGGAGALWGFGGAVEPDHARA